MPAPVHHLLDAVVTAREQRDLVAPIRQRNTRTRRDLFGRRGENGFERGRTGQALDGCAVEVDERMTAVVPGREEAAKTGRRRGAEKPFREPPLDRIALRLVVEAVSAGAWQEQPPLLEMGGDRRDTVIRREDQGPASGAHLRVEQVDEGRQLLVRSQRHVEHLLRVRPEDVPDGVVARQAYGKEVRHVVVPEPLRLDRRADEPQQQLVAERRHQHGCVRAPAACRGVVTRRFLRSDPMRELPAQPERVALVRDIVVVREDGVVERRP